MGYNPNILHLYVGYNPFTNHLLTSWDIRVVSGGARERSYDWTRQSCFILEKDSGFVGHIFPLENFQKQ